MNITNSDLTIIIKDCNCRHIHCDADTRGSGS